VLESVLKEGAYLILSRFACQTALLEKTHRLIRDAVESLEGSAARHVLDTHGLGALHVALPAARIGELRDVVMPQIRPDLLTLACEIGRTVLGIEGEFFVDDYTILRINYPYLVALQAPGAAENPGIGRVADRTRLESNASRVIDPVYDPKGSIPRSKVMLPMRSADTANVSVQWWRSWLVVPLAELPASISI